MRSLVVVLAVFLLLAVLQCEGKRRRKRNASNGDGYCSWNGRTIKDGDKLKPKNECKEVTCNDGLPIIANKTEGCNVSERMDVEERKEEGNKRKRENKIDGKKEKRENKERRGRKDKKDRKEKKAE